MSSRVSLPASLTGASLSRSGEGVTFAPPQTTTASLPGVTMPAPVQTQPAMTIQAPLPSATVIPQPAVASPVVESKAAETPGYRFNPLNIIWLILIFMAVFLILYTTKTNMVTDLVDGDRVLNNGKLIFWSILISLIIAVLGYVIMRMLARKSA